MNKLVSSSNLSTFASGFSNLIKEKYDPLTTDIDYESLLAFDTSEIVFDNNVDVESVAILGKGVLDKLILDYDGYNGVEI